MPTDTTTNRKSVPLVEETSEKARDCGGTCGGSFRYRLGAANKVTKKEKRKYVVALDGRQSAKNHTTTNQKLAAATKGTI